MKIFPEIQKRFVLLIIQSLFSLILFGNISQRIDSLIQELEFQRQDTNKVKILLLISKEYSKNDLGKAKDYINQCVDLATKLKYNPGLIDAFIRKSDIYSSTGNFDSAQFFSKHALQLSIKINDQKRLANSYTQVASVLLRMNGPVNTTWDYYIKSFNIYKKIADSTGYLNSLNNLGVMYRWMAEYDSAVFYFIEYIKLSEKLNQEEGLGKGYVNLGICYRELKDYKNAEYYLNESIKINEKYNQLRFLSLANNNLGNIAKEKNNPDEALYYYFRSLEQCEKAGYIVGVATAKNNIGNVYEMKNDYVKALEYYTIAKDLYNKMGYIDGFIAAYKNIALIHEHQGNYSKALKIYDSLLLMAKTSGLLVRQNEILYNMHKTYELTGDFDKAYKLQTEQIAIKDSIFNQKKDNQIKILQVMYEKEKDQARILALGNENLSKSLALRKRTNQRNGYLYTGSGLVLIISFIFIFYRHRAVKDKIIADQKIHQLEEEKKLLAARAIVDGQEEERKRIAKELHDGLGVLLSTAKMQFSAIKDKSPENKTLIEKASKLLERAAGDVRKISHNMMPGLLTKFGFFDAVEDLFENLNDTEGLTAEYSVEGETRRLPENIEIMLYRVVQEMVNNTLKHANAKNITLNNEVKTDQLIMIYKDDGKGFNSEEKLESKSIGLTSIQSRVKFIGGEMLLTSSPGKGVRYEIQLPLP